MRLGIANLRQDRPLIMHKIHSGSSVTDIAVTIDVNDLSGISNYVI